MLILFKKIRINRLPLPLTHQEQLKEQQSDNKERD
jgi:hypothetical protein